jgi:hypothetical protein
LHSLTPKHIFRSPSLPFPCLLSLSFPFVRSFFFFYYYHRTASGIDVGKHSSDLFHEDPADPAEYVKALREEGSKQDVMGLIFAENMRSHVIGLHSVEVMSGKAKLSLSVQGLDIFDILPKLPSMQAVQDANVLKPAKRRVA